MTKRLKKRLLAVGLTTILGVILVVSWFCGPYGKVFSECGVCGRGRVVDWRLGIPWRWRAFETAKSTWIGTIGVPRHKHIWTRVSSMGKSRWFGEVVAADGGALAWFCNIGRKQLGEQRARQLFEEYRKVLVNEGDNASWKFISDYRLALHCLPAITNEVHSNPAFRDVRIEIQAEGRVPYSVSGTVATEQQKTDLQNFVASSWVDAVYDLRVLSGLP